MTPEYVLSTREPMASGHLRRSGGDEARGDEHWRQAWRSAVCSSPQQASFVVTAGQAAGETVNIVFDDSNGFRPQVAQIPMTPG